MNTFHSGVTLQEQELLVLLAEEAAEVVQGVTKIIRHGWESYDPTLPPGKRPTNREHLQKELGQMELAKRMLVDSKLLDPQKITDAMLAKNETIGEWLHHQPKPGVKPAICWMRVSNSKTVPCCGVHADFLGRLFGDLTVEYPGPLNMDCAYCRQEADVKKNRR